MNETLVLRVPRYSDIICFAFNATFTAIVKTRYFIISTVVSPYRSFIADIRYIMSVWEENICMAYRPNNTVVVS